MNIAVITIVAASTAVASHAEFAVRRMPEQSQLMALWPEDAPRPPATLRQYKKTEYGQFLAIRNNADFHSVAHRNVGHDITVNSSDRPRNGNNEHPWAVPGGTDDARGVTSLTGIALPEDEKPYHWKRKIDAGASRPLPKDIWSFPIKTRVYDLLLNNGKPFELRMLIKRGTPDVPKWTGHTLWESGEWPVGYRGVTKETAPPHLRTTGNKCMDCHSRAGGWERYGPLIRGNDFIFSWSAYIEGTNQIDPTKIKR